MPRLRYVLREITRALKQGTSFAIRPIRSLIYIFFSHRSDRRSTELDCYMLQKVGRRALWDALSWETLWEYSSDLW